MVETIIGAAIVGGLFAKTNKSMEIDEKAMKKNIKAFTKVAEAENKLALCQQNTIEKLVTCAKRKTGILNVHIKLFKEQFELIRKIEFKAGQGIEELGKFDEFDKQLSQSLNVPALESNAKVPEMKTLISFALYGIGGLMIKDSEMNLKMASRNVAQANAVAAQADSVCIALDGVAKHAEIITELLQKLGLLYIRSIKNITSIIKENGMDRENYSQMDIDAINVSLALTKIIYRIINTPIINKEGEVEKESLKVIAEGQQILTKIQQS